MGLNFAETLGVGLATASLAAFLTWVGQFIVAYNQRSNDSIKYRRERLFDRYSELLSVAVQELDRARSAQAAAALWNDQFDPSICQKIDDSRHAYRRDLMRLTLQIRLLEENQQLASTAERLVEAQPFVPFLLPAMWGQGSYNERFEQHQRQITNFEDLIRTLVDAVVQYHAVPDVRTAIRANIQTARETTATFVKNTFRSGPRHQGLGNE